MNKCKEMLFFEINKDYFKTKSCNTRFDELTSRSKFGEIFEICDIERQLKMCLLFVMYVCMYAYINTLKLCKKLVGKYKFSYDNKYFVLKWNA